MGNCRDGAMRVLRASPGERGCAARSMQQSDHLMDHPSLLTGASRDSHHTLRIDGDLAAVATETRTWAPLAAVTTSDASAGGHEAERARAFTKPPPA